jgi:hypothetical protein
MTLEEIYVKHIECGIRAIKLGTKKPEDANVGKFLNKLRDVNDGLYDDLLERYRNVIENYKKNEEKLAYNKKNPYLYKRNN